MTHFDIHAHFHTAQEIGSELVYADCDITEESFVLSPGVICIYPRSYVETNLVRLLNASPRLAGLAADALKEFITATNSSHHD